MIGGGMEDEGFDSGWLEELEGEEELFVGVGFEVGRWGGGRGGEEGLERMGGGLVQALEGAGVQERSEGSL